VYLYSTSHKAWTEVFNSVKYRSRKEKNRTIEIRLNMQLGKYFRLLNIIIVSKVNALCEKN